MTSVLREFPLSYAVLSEGRRRRSASAVQEPSPAGPPYRASSIAPAGPSARATPPRRWLESSAPRVRLHLKPGQTGTKQLLAPYGDRLVCVRYRYDAQRKKPFKPWGSSSAERDWEPPQPRFAPRPDHWATRRLCRRGSPPPGEAGRWNVESRTKVLAAAPDRVVALGGTSRIVNEPGIQYWVPGAARRVSSCRCPGGIQVEMLFLSIHR